MELCNRCELPINYCVCRTSSQGVPQRTRPSDGYQKIMDENKLLIEMLKNTNCPDGNCFFGILNICEENESQCEWCITKQKLIK
jgi:hypothetical protein